MKKPIEVMLVETMSALVSELRELRKSLDENTKLVKESAVIAKRDRTAMIAEHMRQQQTTMVDEVKQQQEKGGTV